MQKDQDYPSAFEAAKQMAADHFEDEIYRREFEGYEKPVTHKGVITDRYRDYCDVLAIFALKGLGPEKYRESAPPATLMGPVSLSISYPAPPEKIIESGPKEKR